MLGLGADAALLNARMARRAALNAAAASAFAGALPAGAVIMNAAELKLQELIAERVAQQEKALGFKFEPDDVAEVEKILRNKYCGKAGLFGAMQGGTCEENVVTAAYCPGQGARDNFYSASAGCEVPKPPRPPDTPPKAPTLPSLPSLPF